MNQCYLIQVSLGNNNQQKLPASASLLLGWRLAAKLLTSEPANGGTHAHCVLANGGDALDEGLNKHSLCSCCEKTHLLPPRASQCGIKSCIGLRIFGKRCGNTSFLTWAFCCLVKFNFFLVYNFLLNLKFCKDIPRFIGWYRIWTQTQTVFEWCWRFLLSKSNKPCISHTY